jgi:hypothetical protein
MQSPQKNLALKRLIQKNKPLELSLQKARFRVKVKKGTTSKKEAPIGKKVHEGKY